MIWLPPLALGLDMLLADPPRLPHPVTAVGLLADRLEEPARKLGARSGHPVLAGALVLSGLCLLSSSLAFLLGRLPGFLGTALSLYLAWAGLALGGLIRAGTNCLASIHRAEADAAALPEARRAVQMLVSRDTGAMDVPDLCRSLAESLSENLNDAFVAPFFWLCLGGPAALWAYKTVSTMDSMWGYKNERFLYLGRASARLDDVLAYVPARISVGLLLTAAWLTSLPGSFTTGKSGTPGKNTPFAHKSHTDRLTASAPDRQNISDDFPNKDNDLITSGSGKEAPCSGLFKFPARLFHVPGWPGWLVVAAQAKKSASPNAGWPMTAAAWLLHGRCGGPTAYDGKILDKPLMGPENGAWNADNCQELIALLRLCGLVCLVFSLLLLSV